MMQMGPRWNHRIDLQPAYRALFTIFASKADRNTAASRKLAKQISMSAKTNKLDFSGTRELLAKHIKSKMVSRAAGPHIFHYASINVGSSKNLRC